MFPYIVAATASEHVLRHRSVLLSRVVSARVGPGLAKRAQLVILRQHLLDQLSLELCNVHLLLDLKDFLFLLSLLRLVKLTFALLLLLVTALLLGLFGLAE